MRQLTRLSSLIERKVAAGSRDTELARRRAEGRMSTAIRRTRLVVFAGAVFSLLIALRADAGTTPAACAGDCNGDSMVSQAELLQGIGTIFDPAGPDACSAFQARGGSVPGVAELLLAVRHAGEGCVPFIADNGVYRTYPGFDVELPVPGIDPDRGPLVYSSDGLPAGAQLDPQLGILSWTPGIDQLGPFYIPIGVARSGMPELSNQGVVIFKVMPPDTCVEPNCNPATGCSPTLRPLEQTCCSDFTGQDPNVRVAEPLVTSCPEGRVLFIGRNISISSFGRMRDCDRLQIVGSGQSGKQVQFNIEARCMPVLMPLTLTVKMTARLTETSNLDFPSRALSPIVLIPRSDGTGFSDKKRLAYPLPGAAPELEGMEAELTVTLADPNNPDASASRSLRVVLTHQDIPLLPDL